MRRELDVLEADEQNAGVLSRLYRVDHATTRVQRLAENLQVLTGRRAGDLEGRATPLLDVVRAAMSAIEHYPRVQTSTVAALAVQAWAADDMGRLLAELLDNATRYSPPRSMVTVSAHVTEQGSVLLRVEDVGIGVDSARIASYNAQLQSEAAGLDPESPGQMGFAVVRRLAHAHGVKVWLARRKPAGTVAMVLVPVDLLCGNPEMTRSRPQPRPLSPPGGEPTARDAATAGPSHPPPDQQRHAAATAPVSASHTDEPAPTRGPQEQVQSGRAVGNLPRRVPASIRESQKSSDSASSADPGEGGSRPSWDADITAFVAGDEEAARHRGDTAHRVDPSEGHAQ